MSHYLAVVLVPRDTTDIEEAVTELLAPYDEGDPDNGDTKWDWWQIGGRWTGTFDPRYNPRTDPANMETCWLCKGTGMRNDRGGEELRAENSQFTCNGCEGTGKSLRWPTSWEPFAGDVMPVAKLPKNIEVFAIVTPDGEWHQRGQMGWWANVTDEKDAAAWQAEVREILAAHGDCIAVACDCHI